MYFLSHNLYKPPLYWNSIQMSLGEAGGDNKSPN